MRIKDKGGGRNAGYMKWITRVPERITEAKKLILSEQEMREVEPGYRVSEVLSQYSGIEQRWLLVFSQHAKEREEKTLKKRITKELIKKQVELNKHSTQDFDCEEDAKKSLERWAKGLNYYKVLNIETFRKNHKQGKGRPNQTKLLKQNIAHIPHPLTSRIDFFKWRAKNCKYMISSMIHIQDYFFYARVSFFEKQVHSFKNLKNPSHGGFSSRFTSLTWDGCSQAF